MLEGINEWSHLFDCHGPTVIGFVGPNGSGKSSIVEKLGIRGVQPGNPCYKGRMAVDPSTGDLLMPIVNPDEVARAVAANNPDLSADECNRRAFKEAQEIRDLYAEAKIDFAFETVGSHPSRVEFLEGLKSQGYTVGVLFVGTDDPDINVRRVRQRVSHGGHDVPLDKIVDRYERTMSLLPSYFSVADHMSVYDNSIDCAQDSGGGPKLLLVKERSSVALTSDGQNSNWLKKRLKDLF